MFRDFLLPEKNQRALYPTVCSFLYEWVIRSKALKSRSSKKHHMFRSKVVTSDGIKKPKGFITPLNEESLWMEPVYEIGALSSITK